MSNDDQDIFIYRERAGKKKGEIRSIKKRRRRGAERNTNKDMKGKEEQVSVRGRE